MDYEILNANAIFNQSAFNSLFHMDTLISVHKINVFQLGSMQ